MRWRCGKLERKTAALPLGFGGDLRGGGSSWFLPSASSIDVNGMVRGIEMVVWER